MGATVLFADVNELTTLSNTFSVSGTPTDPTTVTLTVTSPTNVVTSYTWPSPATLTHGTAGVFSTTVASGEAGTWQYMWVGTGTASDVTVGTWEVYETSLGHLYITAEALKSRLRNTGTTADDTEVYEACVAASRAIESECDRTFWRTTSQARTFEPQGSSRLKLGDFNDLVSITTLKTDASGDGVYETTWTASDYQLLPLNPQAAPETRPYTEIRAVGSYTFPSPSSGARRDLIEITGVWGWPAVPWAIKQAARVLAADTYALKGERFGVAQFGDLTVNIGTARVVEAFVKPYRRHPVGSSGQKLFVA